MLHMKGSDYSLISEEGTSGSDHSSYESGSWVECLTLYPQSCSAYNLLQYCFFVVAHLWESVWYRHVHARGIIL